MTPLVPGPAYRIKTKRLVIRCYNPVDASVLKTSVDESREHLRFFLPWAAGEPQSLQSYIDLLRQWRAKFDLGEEYVYGVFSPDEKRLIGSSGLHTRLSKDTHEIGYWIHKDFIHQGYATEVSAALTRAAFEINQVRRVEIHMAVENAPSAAVPHKLGFTLEATLRQSIYLEDRRYHDRMIWSLLIDEYSQSPCAGAQIEAYDAIGRQIL